MIAIGAVWGSVRRQLARVPVAWRTDIPVGVVAVVCWLALPIFLAHVLVGCALIGLVGHHLRTRRLRVLVGRHGRSSSRSTVRTLAYWVFLVGTAAMVVTGLLRLVGVPPDQSWHAASSYFMLGSATVHVIAVRVRLRRRLSHSRVGRNG
ncbi:hypothetical protein GCM10017691_19060 [Pseudonocardia petroleophila]|uniref:DUF4405 domain-containing protein n=1 Tax=Pseudonocardia petroleophila TaxID=37331 RepID=A0A7G7MH03_9PSEU|nr:hypothetical protein [Pseudonocardia petroleophila]QNG52064.1 hypothetical protein H6H00_29060 [Pseudonocardia petroleophila]